MKLNRFCFLLTGLLSLSLFSPWAQAADKPLLSDNFDDGDFTTAPLWKPLKGTWQVKDNALNVTGDAEFSAISTSDFTPIEKGGFQLSFDVKFRDKTSSGQNRILVALRDKSGKGYQIEIAQGTSNNTLISRLDPGSVSLNSVLLSPAFKFPEDEFVPVVFSLNPDGVIAVSVNGQDYLKATDKTYTQFSQIQINSRSPNATLVQDFDNVQLTEAPLVKPVALGAANKNWYQPAKCLWALQETDFSVLFQKPSSPLGAVVAKGKDAPKIGRALWFKNKDWRTANFRLQKGFQGENVAVWGQSAEQKETQLPALPAGAYWLTAKAYDDQKHLLERKVFFLNILESQQSAPSIPVPLPKGEAELESRIENQTLTVAGLEAFSPRDDLVLQVNATTLAGEKLSSQQRALKEIKSNETRFDLPVLSPGQSLWLDVSLDSPGGRFEQNRLLLSQPGSTPPLKKNGTLETDAIKLARPSQILSTETLSIFQPLKEQKPAVDIFLSSMKQRGSDAVQLNSLWSFIEIQQGVYDWSRLDDYVNYLTEKKVPFVLGTTGSALFMTMPLDCWGEWMTDQRGETQLWRDLPTVTPLGPRYREAVRNFTARMVERYRDNPYLVGYNFINQGADSAVFFDTAGSITDYSPWARQQFRSFLEQRYSTIEKLNTNWDSQFGSWSEVEPPLPLLAQEVDISTPWRDFTEFKLKNYREASTGLFDDVVRERDAVRPISHYAAYTGPFEYLFADFQKNRDGMSDGGGEDNTLSRINGISFNGNIPRITESHEVPPANRLAMQDMSLNALRYGLKDTHFNLVWNSQVSSHEKNYPNNAKLKDSMTWWEQNISVLRSLKDSVPADPRPKSRVGAVLSWSDLFYRTRLWRWYAMPGRNVSQLTEAASLLPVTWITELTPPAQWENLDLIIVPADAMVWDESLTRKLSSFVNGGRKLAIWGRAGQYTPGQKQSFAWLKQMGQPEAQVALLNKSVSAELEWQNQNLPLSIGVEAKNFQNATLIPTRAQVNGALQWKFGQGQICWILGDVPFEKLGDLGVALSQWAQVQPAIVSSDQRVQGFWLQQGERRFLVVSQFLGLSAINRLQQQEQITPPLQARISLPALEGERWNLKWLTSLPKSAPPAAQTLTATQLKAGFEVTLDNSEFQIIEFKSVPTGQITP